MNGNSLRISKALQYQVEIFIKSAEVKYSSTFNFKLMLKRGNKLIETKNTTNMSMLNERTSK
jgi:hypothetical protein